jgi:adenylate cyclase
MAMDTVQGSLLIVDDNAMNRDMLARRLARRGYTVAVAENGHQALAMVAEQQFDLVLLDIMMPGISGLEVLRLLRQRYSVADLPVIMATAKDQSEDVVAALKLGANDYVTKPLDFPVVLARTQTHLSLKRAMEHIQHLADQLEVRNRFIRETFGRYLTDEVVANLLDAPEGLRLGGAKRQVTMLMADLRGFTSLAGRLEPEQVVTLINRYLGTMAEIIAQHQGTIDEFIGDAIFVIFGAPIQRYDDARRAVACALAMQLALETVNAQNRHEGIPEVEMGIGIHTGEVVVGNIGSHKRAKYGVVGSHVNLTSRIESFTIGGQVLISEATKHAVDCCLRIAEQMELEAKGIPRPVRLYDVQGIGEPYNLSLPETAYTLFPLEAHLPIRYTSLEGKYLDDVTCTGHVVKLSAKGCEIFSDAPVSLWSNLKMQLLDHQGGMLHGDLYAKVLRHLPDRRAGFYAHFTFIPPEVATFFRRLLDPDTLR